MWRSVFSRTTSSDTDGFEELDSCYLEPDGFLLPIFDSRDEQLPTSETTEVPTSSDVCETPQPSEQYSTSDTDVFDCTENYFEGDGPVFPITDSGEEQLPDSESTDVPTSSDVCENLEPRDQYSHTISSDTDFFECLGYYLDPDGLSFPIIDSGDEQLPTSETTEVPSSSVSVNINEKCPTNDSNSIDSVSAVLPEPSDADGSEENFQQEEGKTIFSRVQTSLSALSSFIMAPVESVGRGVISVTSQIFNIGRAPFTSPTSETELPPTSETAEVCTTSVSVNISENEQSTILLTEPSDINIGEENFQREEAETSTSRVHEMIAALHSSCTAPESMSKRETSEVPTTSVSLNTDVKEQSTILLTEPSEIHISEENFQREEAETSTSRVHEMIEALYSSCTTPESMSKRETSEVPTPSVSLNTDEKEQSPTSKKFVDSRDQYNTPNWAFLFEPENTTREQRLNLTSESEERNEQSPSETAEVPITSVHMNNLEHEQSPTSEAQVPTTSDSERPQPGERYCLNETNNPPTPANNASKMFIHTWVLDTVRSWASFFKPRNTKDQGTVQRFNFTPEGQQRNKQSPFETGQVPPSSGYMHTSEDEDTSTSEN